MFLLDGYFYVYNWVAVCDVFMIVCNHCSSLLHCYCMQKTAEGFVFGAISLWFFVCVWNISGTAKRICAKFTRKRCLVPRSDEFEGHQGQKRHFLALLMACVQFVFGKTSVVFSYHCYYYLLLTMWSYLQCIVYAVIILCPSVTLFSPMKRLKRPSKFFTIR